VWELSEQLHAVLVGVEVACLVAGDRHDRCPVVMGEVERAREGDEQLGYVCGADVGPLSRRRTRSAAANLAD
jgi:hypothetical protein